MRVASRVLLTVSMTFLSQVAAHARSKNVTAEGIWKSEGYGYVFQVDKSQVQAFEITSVSCIATWKSMRIEKGPDMSDDPGWVENPLQPHDSKKYDMGWWFGAGFAGGDEAFQILPTQNKDVQILHKADGYDEFILHRITGLPRACTKPPESTPLMNYDVFWATFAENYPYFSLYGVDWDAVNRKFRPQVSSRTTPHELFTIFKQMLEPVVDAHVLLQAFPPSSSLTKAWERTDALEQFWQFKPDPDPFEEADFDAAAKLIEDKYIHGGVQHFCNNKVRFGILGNSVGYLGITSFHDYTDDDDYTKGLELIKTAANKVFEQTRSLKALIIDIRVNGGGNDPYEMVIASHLTGVPYFASLVKARNSATDPTSFTTPQKLFVRPAAGPRFLGKTVLLTGRITASGGEGLVLSLMSRVPHILRVGENTQGAFSEELDRRLPNDWRVVLPNEVDLSVEGKSFHHVGVPPDIRVTGLRKADIAAGKDPGLEKALKIVPLP